MLAEARIVGKLSHPDIVALFDAGQDGDVPYLVFEYVEGQTLGDLIRDSGTLAPHEAARIAGGLLAGVDYAHEAGVVHRDLKPANIMLTREGVPRVMDFGIASHTRVEAGKTGDQVLSGTPSYMAPEYLSGAAFSPRCDVFAAGMVLYEMLTGAPAVKGATHHQTMYAIVKEPLARPSTRNQAIDEKLEAIVMRALEKDPLARYASAAAMMAALTEYANPQPQQAARAGGGDGGTLDFLLRRMRYKSDFPVLSSTISTVNHLVASENERADALAVGPQAQYIGTSPSCGGSASPKSGCARSPMPSAAGSPLCSGAPCASGAAAVMAATRATSAAANGRIDTTSGPPNGPRRWVAIRVRNRPPWMPCSTWRMRMPARAIAASLENRQPSTKATNSSCQSAPSSVREVAWRPPSRIK